MGETMWGGAFAVEAVMLQSLSNEASKGNRYQEGVMPPSLMVHDTRPRCLPISCDSTGSVTVEARSRLTESVQLNEQYDAIHHENVVYRARSS